MRYVRRALKTVLLTMSMVVFIRVLIEAMGSSRRGRMRTFNKHVTNRLAMSVIAHLRTPYGVVHHVGRRSGKPYTTPVVAKVTGSGILIPLPYGADTDWCLNVMESGGCTLTLNGQTYELTSPHVVDAELAEALLPAANAHLWHWMGMKQYLLLAIGRAATVPFSTREAARL